MSTSGLTNQYIPNTLDGLNVIEADQVYINGQSVELDNLVPYTGATKTLNMGSQNIQTSHTPSAPNDVINLTTLTNAVVFIDNTTALSFLNKVTSTAQTVAGSTTFNSSLNLANDKEANLASMVVIGPTYQNLITSASVTVSQNFGTITNAGGVYESTTNTAGGAPVLIMFPVVVDKKYRFTIEVLVTDAVYDWFVNPYQSTDNINPATGGVLTPLLIPTNTVAYQLIDLSFTAVITGNIIFDVASNAPAVNDKAFKWKNLKVYESGVSLTNASYPSLSADRVAVINDKKQLVSSGISITKLDYLDNVSSDIQTQLNARVLRAGDTMTGNLHMGANTITSSYTPVNDDDLTRKEYVDTQNTAQDVVIATKASTSYVNNQLSFYLPKTGGTMTGTLVMGFNRVSCSSDPMFPDDLARKGYVDSALSNLIGTVNIGGINLATTAVMKWASLANHITNNASEAFLFNGVNGYIAIGRNTNRSASEANLHLGTTGLDCSIESISSDGSGYLPMGYYASRHYFASGNVGVGTTAVPCSGINFQNNGTGLCWGNGFSRILDDAHMRICSDDQMYFYIGSTASSYGTQRAVLTSSSFTTAVDINPGPYAFVLSQIGDCRIYNGTADAYNPTSRANNLLIKSWWGIGFESFDGGVRIGMDTRTGSAYFGGNLGIGIGPSYKLDVNGNCRISTTLDVGGNDHLRLSNEGSHRRIQSFAGIPLHINPLGNTVQINSQGNQTNINGIVNVRGNSPYAVPNGYMTNGSLTIGSGDANYGWSNNWSGNTAGLMMECADLTDIVIHDAGLRLASFMSYAGGVGRNLFILGRDMGFGTSFVYTAARFSVATDTQYGHFNIYNPDGSNTHFGTSERTNYIRGGMSLFDTSTNSSWYLQHYLENSGLRAHNAYGTWGVAIWAGATIVTQSWFGTVSDRRIKTNIKPVGSLLDVINKIEVVSFDFIDSVTHKRDECGVIAQQLEEVFPNAVDKSQGVISNIVQRATRYELNDGKMTIEYKRSDADELVVGCRVKLIIGSHEKEADKHTNGDYIAKVLTVNANSIVVEWNEEFSMDGLSVVVYGKEVDDFRNVDKEQLAVMSIKGIQELSQQMDIIVQRNNVLEAWARQQEEKVKEQEVKQRKLEKDIQKMASLISQLMGK